MKPGVERKFAERQTKLQKADSIEEQVSLCLEWLTDRIEQHEVFGNEVGTETDYIMLKLCERVLRNADKYL